MITFSKHTLARFLGCDIQRINRILDQLKIAHWYKRNFTEAEARAVMAQYYYRKGRRIAGRVPRRRDKD